LDIEWLVFLDVFSVLLVCFERALLHAQTLFVYAPELLEVKGCSLKVKGLDAKLGSPSLDIKLHHPHSDSNPNAKLPGLALIRNRGWTNVCVRSLNEK